MNKLAPIEFVRGFVAVLPICFKVGWIGVSIAGLSGLLYCLGGTYSKLIRRLGIPVSIVLYMVILGFWYNWLLLTIPIGFGILSLGDGFPDHRPTTLDEGSWLGRLVEKVLDGVPDDIGGEITKWIIVLLFQLALVPVYVS